MDVIVVGGVGGAEEEIFVLPRLWWQNPDPGGLGFGSRLVK